MSRIGAVRIATSEALFGREAQEDISATEIHSSGSRAFCLTFGRRLPFSKLNVVAGFKTQLKDPTLLPLNKGERHGSHVRVERLEIRHLYASVVDHVPFEPFDAYGIGRLAKMQRGECLDWVVLM